MNNIHLQNNNGQPFDLFVYQGPQPLLLIFFRGAWCHHCKRQLQEIQGRMTDFQQKGIKILALSPDSAFKSSLIKTFLKLEFPVLSDADFKVIDAFKVRGEHKGKVTAKPSVFLLSPAHEIVYQYISEEYENFDEHLTAEQLLKNLPL